MAKESVLIVGLGEIGHTVFSLLSEHKDIYNVYGIDLDAEKMRKLKQDPKNLPSQVYILHICLPCGNQKKFLTVTADYINKFNPRVVINNSTVPPGTTLKMVEGNRFVVAHSPSRGVHKDADHMLWEMKRWTKYVGGANPGAAEVAKAHFEKLGLKVKVLKSSTETELAKLFETTYRAWMIACFQEMHRIARAFGADFNETVDFLEDTHRQRFDRPIMFPGVIGGHCLIPNTELLLDVYDSEFLRLILKSNDMRTEEVKDKDVKAEVARVAARAIALEKEIAGEKNETTDPNQCG